VTVKMTYVSAMQRFRRNTARHLRANATGAEVRLWKLLRALPVFGSHFRRQEQVGPYVADFACQASRLIIEVDGSQHGRPHEVERDRARSAWLTAEGYRVLRFWNNDLVENPDGVLEAIYAALYDSINSEATQLKHKRRPRSATVHPTPARVARRPSPSKGG
jgi:very-short-patch-repair endonuclease